SKNGCAEGRRGSYRRRRGCRLRLRLRFRRPEPYGPSAQAHHRAVLRATLCTSNQGYIGSRLTSRNREYPCPQQKRSSTSEKFHSLARLREHARGRRNDGSGFADASAEDSVRALQRPYLCFRLRERERSL